MVFELQAITSFRFSLSLSLLFLPFFFFLNYERLKAKGSSRIKCPGAGDGVPNSMVTSPSRGFSPGLMEYTRDTEKRAKTEQKEDR